MGALSEAVDQGWPGDGPTPLPSGAQPIRSGGSGAIDWQRYLADLRQELDEAYAKLCFAERHLGNPVLELAPRPAVRLVREQWIGAARRLDDLNDADSTAPVVLDALGRERGLVRVAGRTTQVRRRHTEILVLLASRPDGMTTEELALAVYGEQGRPGSVRTELFRLRKAVPNVLYGERNLVKLQIEADFLVVQRLLRSGRAREAAQAYSAALLPRSEAPGVVDLRHELDAWVRSAVMTSGDREALWAWLDSASGSDDMPAWKRFLADLDPADPRRAYAVSRLARLRNALTVVD
jgi:hypothetical protein